MAGRHGNKGVISKVVPVEDMPFLANGRAVDIILNPMGVPGRMNLGQVLETHLGWSAHRLGFRAVTPVFDGATERQIAAELTRAWITERAGQVVSQWTWEWLAEIGYKTELLEDDDAALYLFLSGWLADKGYDMDRLRSDKFYAAESMAREWLRQRGYNPDQVFPNEEGRHAYGDENDEATIRIGTIEWYAAALDRHGDDLAAEYRIDPAAVTPEELNDKSIRLSFDLANPLPYVGKEALYDGKTGEQFAQSVTVGIMHMLKLAHLVEDKVHARSTGPYSLVTQQPLGGKAQFGGQRFGEMEVWALEAYGAAYTLQEMITVKSDDVQGRVKTYESIVKDEAIEDPGIPASFRVLVKELQSLGLAVEAVVENGETIRFGKEDDKKQQRQQQIPSGTGLMDLARNRR